MVEGCLVLLVGFFEIPPTLHRAQIFVLPLLQHWLQRAVHLCNCGLFLLDRGHICISRELILLQWVVVTVHVAF